MRFTYEEIKKELKENYDEINSDDLAEWADGFVPVYYNEIMRDWAEMPSEFSERWREFTCEITFDTTICGLMAQDLYFYYLEQCERAFRELQEEAEETADN